MASIYALLVGINNYPISPLNGCINDVNAVDEYLKSTYSNQAGLTLKIKRITDQDPTQPTRDNIIAGFDHFNEAGDDDTCLFYYCGHGSFVPAPPEFWEEADMKSESFVCIDSRVSGGRDLLDKEMGYLIWKTMSKKKNTRMVVITDCCHSGTITRDIDRSGIRDRMMSDASEPVELENYLGFRSEIDGVKYYESKSVAGLDKPKAVFKQGNHIHISASRDNQTAKELSINGLLHGAFTYSLLKVLYAAKGQITYQDLVNRTGMLVRNIVSDQNPSLHINGTEEPGIRDQIFLTKTAIKPGSFLVYFDPKWKWCIKAGAIHGVSKGDDVAIEGIGNTVVSGTPGADFSTIEAVAGLEKNDDMFTGVITRQPNQPLDISFDPEFTGDKRQMIEKHFADSTRATSRIVEPGNGRFIIRNDESGAFITKPGSTMPLIKPIPIVSLQNVLFFAERIELVSKWFALQELNQSSFDNKPYRIDFYRGRIAGNYDVESFEKVKPGDDLNEFYYQEDDDKKWYQPAFKLSITNTGDVPLFISNAYLGFDYSVSTDFFDEIQLLAPGKESWLTFINDGKSEDTILLNLDDKFAKLGYLEISEYLKLFIATQQIDTDRLKQDGLEMPLMRSMDVKGRGVSSVSARKPSDAFKWAVETIGLKIIRPAAKTAISPGAATSLLSITIAPHQALKANVNMQSSAVAGRSAGAIPSPNAAKQNSYLQPFNLNSGTRSTDQVDILELTDVQQQASVTPENPLVLKTGHADVTDVVPVGFDAATGLYFPLGFGNATGDIIIETLPDPTAVTPLISSRSLTGSIKIYFQKILGKTLGLKYTYPRLAIATVNDDLSVNYNSDTGAVKAAVASATNIIVFIHGIIGDTESILKSVKTRFADTPLSQKFDLVLSFDYENLNTKIEENSALLKQRLADVGIADGSGKKITIAAHSMGGLVSRWFIEKLGGNQ
ncbi:MAG: caspase family protein, partial [Flavitalea sp.]